MKIISIDLNRCIGCRNCEQACAFHGTGGFNRRDANIRVNIYPGERFVSTLTCSHCETPSCMEICPSGALKRDTRTHAVVVDENLCVGCKMCMMACPFGNIYFNAEKHIVQKCNLCNGDPKCTLFCMSCALDYTEVDDLPELKRRAVDNRLLRYLVIQP